MEQMNIASILWDTKVYNPNLRGKTAGLRGLLPSASWADKRRVDMGPVRTSAARQAATFHHKDSRSRNASVLGALEQNIARQDVSPLCTSCDRVNTWSYFNLWRHCYFTCGARTSGGTKYVKCF